MRPIFKSALTLLAVACVLGVFFAGRWIMAVGLFTSVTPVSAGTCRVLTALPGPEDFAVDAPHNAMFVSVMDRRQPGPADGLYLVKLDDPGAAPLRLSGTPKDFHPGRISLYRAGDGAETLMAINRPSAGPPSIDIFIVTYPGGVATLNPGSSIAGGLLVSPSGLFAVGPNHFYVSNDHVSQNTLGRFAEDDLLWAHSDLLYFDGMSFRIAVQRLASPHGVLVTPDGAHLYVAAANEKRLIAFSREPFTGNLTEIGALSLPARPDRLAMDGTGNLIVAAHPNLLRLQAFLVDPAKPSPSEVFQVQLDDKGVPQTSLAIYANDGSQIGAASAAAVWNGHLLLASRLDGKLLSCDRK